MLSPTHTHTHTHTDGNKQNKNPCSHCVCMCDVEQTHLVCFFAFDALDRPWWTWRSGFFFQVGPWMARKIARKEIQSIAFVSIQEMMRALPSCAACWKCWCCWSTACEAESERERETHTWKMHARRDAASFGGGRSKVCTRACWAVRACGVALLFANEMRKRRRLPLKHSV